MSYEVKREANDGSVNWTNTVTGVTAYRTDLASGVTAATVPYSDAHVSLTYDTALSGVGPGPTTVSTAVTASA